MLKRGVTVVEADESHQVGQLTQQSVSDSNIYFKFVKEVLHT